MDGLRRTVKPVTTLLNSRSHSTELATAAQPIAEAQARR